MDSKLTAEQEKLAALIESDYAVLKFGYYGQEYEFAVAERDPRLYRKMLKRPDYHQFIADKDKQYRHETSVMMAFLASQMNTPVVKNVTEKEAWRKEMLRVKPQAEVFTINRILEDVASDF